MNGYSLIYVALYVFAQPRLGNILYKVIIANHEISLSEPRNFKIFFSYHHTMQDWASTSWLSKLLSSSERLGSNCPEYVPWQSLSTSCRTTLTCSHFKIPQVQSENIIMYQIIHPTPSFDTIVIFIFDVVIFSFDIVKRSNIPHNRQSIGI